MREISGSKCSVSNSTIVTLCSLMFVGAITSATINFNTYPGTSRLLDRNDLQLVIEGITTGAQQTSVTWRRNGSMITTGGGFFIGGGDTLHTGSPPCASRMYRVAMQANGYLPGSYTYTADNADTTDPGVSSPVFEVQGMYLNINNLYLLYISLTMLPNYRINTGV